MKKIASLLILVFVFTLTTEAQRKKGKRPQLSIEQHTNLMVKQMTLNLDLSERQQNQITPLIKAQVAEKMATMKKRKENRENKKKPTADEIYEMKSKHLDAKIAFKNKMKQILNKEQFEEFKKMRKKREQKAKKKMKMKMKKAKNAKKKMHKKRQKNN